MTSRILRRSRRSDLSTPGRGLSSPVGTDDALPPPVLVAENLSLGYTVAGGQTYCAVERVDLVVRDGSFVCIVGPSGCGKSSLLNAIAGLQPFARGSLTVNGTPVTGSGRDRAMVFQDASLLPWRTVVDNVRYGVELRGEKGPEVEERVAKMVSLVGLEGSEHRYPHQLSGGMRQRVNLARALTADPALLLLDEPFAALDAQTRTTMQAELLRIWERARKTAIFVTHQIDEAVLLADQVIVMSRGPGSVVREVVDITFPRPRHEGLRRTDAFHTTVDRIESLIDGSADELPPDPDVTPSHEENRDNEP